MSARVVIVLFLLYTTCFAQGPKPVRTAKVEKRSLTTTVELVATTHAWRRSMVAAEVEGLVTELSVREGRFVEAGMSIARLSRELALSRIAAAAAVVDAEQAALDELVAGSRPEAIEQAKAAFDESVRQRGRAKEKLDQVSKQVKDGAASIDELNDAETNHDTAVLRCNRLEAAWKLVKNGPREEEIRAAKAKLARARADHKLLLDEDAKRTIVAPIPGIVLRRSTEVGQWVSRGSAIVELMDVSRIEVTAALPQRFADKVRVGRRATIRLEAFAPGETFETTVDRIGVQAQERGRSFPLYFSLPNPKHRLRAGLSARVTLDVGEPRTVIAAPQDALFTRNGAPYLCAVKDGVAEWVFLKTGMRSRGWVEVSGPVREGMTVVVRGNERVLPGDKVVEAGPTPQESRANGNGR